MRIDRALMLAMAVVLTAAACSDSNSGGTLRIYTSVTQGTVDAVVAGFEEDNAGVEVEVFRAPTGELAARIAAEQREGGMLADVLWLTDPLSMQAYDAQGELRGWSPGAADAVPDEYQGDRFWGTRVLNMVLIHGDGVPAPGSWQDLAGESYRDGVVFPDPGFAGSAFAVLGFFAATDGYGIEFYEDLASNGAVQVSSPGEVVTGVAEGRFAVGITLDFVARNAVDNGSPISIVWPEPGAISLYSPIAVVEGTDDAADAEHFVTHVLGVEAQEAIASTGWQPVHPDVDWEPGGAQVSVDWTLLFDRQDELLAAYRAIFDG